MGWRIRSRVRLGKGAWLNVGKTGASFSTRSGPVTWNSRGRTTIRVAKGISYVIEQPRKKLGRAAGFAESTETQSPGHPLLGGLILLVILASVVYLIVTTLG